MDINDTPEMIEGRARALGAPVFVLEACAAAGRHHATRGDLSHRLVVFAILATPSFDDSRYRVAHVGDLYADDPAAVGAALAGLRQLAGRLGAKLYPDCQQLPARQAPRWLSHQGPSPARSWPMSWARSSWRADGTILREEGEPMVEATSGQEALWRMQKEVTDGQVPPLLFAARAKELGSATKYYCPPEAPTTPPRDLLRTMALQGRPLSAILRWMAAEAGQLTVLDRMMAIESAFKIDLDSLDAVGAFCRDELSDTALDEALGPVIKANQSRWSLPMFLHQTHARGHSVGPLMHEHYKAIGGPFALFAALKEAFGIDVGSGKELVVTACRDANHPELVTILTEAIKHKPVEAPRTDSGAIHKFHGR